MANLSDIRSRISSVKNTQKITQAMKLVSAAKLKRAQGRITRLRPYAISLRTSIADIAVTQRVSHPLLSRSENPKNVLLVVLTSDRGLCGGFNANINKFAMNYYKENKDNYQKLDFIFVGKKGKDYFKHRGVEGIDTILDLAREVSYALAAEVAEKLKHEFSEGDYDEIRLVYNEFKSPIQQDVVCETILPVDIGQSELNSEEVLFSKDLIFEPEPEMMIDVLLKKHFSTQVYRAMTESVASEHGARMTAMDNSTKNANEMIDSMTLTYNKLRQAAITTELTEIVSGAEALNG
ncbi:MAG: ATP synthase F1 subunit gamma [Bdellovibrionaceae bacterium]|jgi:F-type H+-transporting ATPase subunit gamma|nr:ATP synthase F1 subunit gamma [Pseudobdellovibrionaceae bacterium]